MCSLGSLASSWSSVQNLGHFDRDCHHLAAPSFRSLLLLFNHLRHSSYIWVTDLISLLHDQDNYSSHPCSSHLLSSNDLLLFSSKVECIRAVLADLDSGCSRNCGS
ncbi:hypothetical protein ACH5RR_018678 [Cinchona calisaya]|uniref:Uncharacterized protein n=1 Tax=Cinchona calisaya TaxID=153742 RepID=A0ABD2ZM45_9GENT